MKTRVIALTGIVVILIVASIAIRYLITADNDKLPEIIQVEPRASIELISIQIIEETSVVEISGQPCIEEIRTNIYPSGSGSVVTINCAR